MDCAMASRPSRHARLVEEVLRTLLFRKPPSVPPAPTVPITFPAFEPTDTQKTNMLRIIELLKISPPKYGQEYPVELVELYRELGMFEQAKTLIESMNEANKDNLTKLLYDLCGERQAAPVRHKYESCRSFNIAVDNHVMKSMW
jgi:hypothetical protein